MKTVYHEGVTSLIAEEPFQRDKTPVIVFKKKFPSFHHVSLHYHSSIEINVCTGIDGELNTEKGPLSLTGERVIIIPPSVLHSYRIHPSTGEMIIIHFSLSLFSTLLNAQKLRKEVENIAQDTCITLTQFCEDFRPTMETLSPILRSSRSQPDKSISLYQAASVMLSLIDVIQKNSNTKTDLGSHADNSFLKHVIQFTEKNYHQPLSAGAVCRHFGYSKAHFCRTFKRGTGMTYGEYINDVRCEHAAELLIKSGKNVTEIAVETGYYDASHFIGSFKSKHGLTPGQYRAKHLSRCPAVHKS